MRPPAYVTSQSDLGLNKGWCSKNCLHRAVILLAWVKAFINMRLLCVCVCVFIHMCVYWGISFVTSSKFHDSLVPAAVARCSLSSEKYGDRSVRNEECRVGRGSAERSQRLRGPHKLCAALLPSYSPAMSGSAPGTGNRFTPGDRFSFGSRSRSRGGESIASDGKDSTPLILLEKSCRFCKKIFWNCLCKSGAELKWWLE